MPAAARLLLFCALLSASASSMGMTIYKTVDNTGVVSYSDRYSPGAKTFELSEPILDRVDGKVRLQAETFPGGVRFMVRNELYVPMQVELLIDKLSNAFGGNQPRSIRTVVGPRSSKVLSSVLAAPGGQLQYATRFQYAMGDPGQRSLAYRYPFPWKGGPFRLTQGPNGRFSHFGPRSRYAMDIAMPEGTPIIAARRHGGEDREWPEWSGHQPGGQFRADPAPRRHHGCVPAPDAWFGLGARGATGGGRAGPGQVGQYR